MTNRITLLAALLCALSACGGETTATHGTGEVVEAHPGEKIYLQACFSCHASGISGAPRTGDTAAWSERAAKGMDVLVANTREGVPPAMPPMGLCQSCSDEDFASVIEYMLVESGVE